MCDAIMDVDFFECFNEIVLCDILEKSVRCDFRCDQIAISGCKLLILCEVTRRRERARLN